MTAGEEQKKTNRMCINVNTNLNVLQNKIKIKAKIYMQLMTLKCMHFYVFNIYVSYLILV